MKELPVNDNDSTREATVKLAYAIQEGGGGGGSSQPLIDFAGRKVIYVSKGTAATDTRGSNSKYSYAVPFETLTAAKTASASGDTIVVEPGAYAVTESLAKNGVNWHFFSGASVSFSDNVGGEGVWDDDGTEMVFNVTGEGDFTRTRQAQDATICPLIKCSHASSVMSIESRDLFIVGGETGEGDSQMYAIEQTAGQLFVKFRECTATGENLPYGIWWQNGKMHVEGKLLTSSYVGVASVVSSTPTGDGFVNIDEIIGSTYAVGSFGSNADAAFWVNAFIVRSNENAVSILDAGRLYVTAQKLFGKIYANIGDGSALLYVQADKISAVQDAGVLLDLTNPNLTSYINIQHYDPAGFTASMISMVSGTATLDGGAFTSVSGANGLTISGGTLKLDGLTINTSASAAHNPVTKSGGTLILKNCTLVAEGTRDSISAATAQNVKVYGTTVANKAKDADVTILVNPAGFIVSADVP